MKADKRTPSTLTRALRYVGRYKYADIFLNGEKIGSVQNMFIPHEFCVDGKLKAKENLLEVKFRSPVKEVEGLPLNEGDFTRERLNTRRIQCTYSWDWVDRFVTCGIFLPVYIKYGNDIHADNIYIYTENVDKYSAQMYLEINFANYEKGDVADVVVISPKGEIVHEFKIYTEEEKYVCRFDVENPELWYPNGYGEHPLYRIVIKVGGNEFIEHFGIRTIKVLQLKDKEGSEYYKKSEYYKSVALGEVQDENDSYSGFKVIVNGVPIFCCGANWVPCEPFPSEEKEEKYKALIKHGVDMGLNMLRVWGGGYFEKRYLYDECDKNGILVTQDFLMACGTYPEKEEWFLKELRLESEFAAKYLRNHPCLAWWSGDNENATAGNDTMSDYRGRASATKGICDNVYKYDHSRQFFRSSPFGGNPYGSVTIGTTHNTNYVCQLFNYFHDSDCKNYKEFFADLSARFIAEEPVFGTSSRSSMLKFMTEEDLLDPDKKMILQHTKTNPWLVREILDDCSEFAEKALGGFSDMEDRFFKYKYMQYEWMRISFETARNNLGYCDGLVFWMFNDCWPAAMGWSILDYYCLPKASYYIFKRCTNKVIGSVTKKDGNYRLTLSNIKNCSADVEIIARLCDIEKGMAVVKEERFNDRIDGYSIREIKLPFDADEKYAIICDIKTENGVDRAFYKDGILPLHKVDNGVEIIEKTANSITFKANTYIHALEMEGQYVFSDNYFSLFKGETKTVTFCEYNNENSDDFTVLTYTL